jgi:hypothetical protein
MKKEESKQKSSSTKPAIKRKGKNGRWIFSAKSGDLEIMISGGAGGGSPILADAGKVARIVSN